MDSTDTWHLYKVDKADDGSATLVTVRVWYEGQDEKCYSNNVDTAGTDITLTFSKVPKNQAQDPDTEIKFLAIVKITTSESLIRR